MNKTRDRADLLAGILIVAAVASLIFIALRAADLGNINTATTYSIDVKFTNIGQLKPRSPVKSSGINVGRVASMRLDGDEYEAIVSLELEAGYRFPRDSVFSIVSTNLLGDQYINIEAGGDEEYLAAGDTRIGNSAIILEDLISKFLFDEAGEEEEPLL